MLVARPVVVTPEDGTFTPRFEDIERAVTSYTRAIIVNSPNNPSGVIYPPELIEKIVDFCERKGIAMICDDIYHKLTFDRKQAVPAYHFTKKDVEDSNLIIVNGVAKIYGMTGFRVGWVIAPRALVRVMTNVTAQTTSGVSPVSQAAAEGALNGMQSVVEALRLIGRGLDNTAIAQELVLTKRTVQNHISNLYAKLGVSSRTEAALLAIRHGLTDERP